MLNKKLSDVFLSDVFDVYRGKCSKTIKLKGKQINFYNCLLNDSSNSDKYFIGLQNIAYRFTLPNIIATGTWNVTCEHLKSD